MPAVLARLTQRELGIMRLVAAGLTNGDIAARLVVGEATVKTHLNRIFAKLGLESRVQLVVLAYECGFVVPGTTTPVR